MSPECGGTEMLLQTSGWPVPGCSDCMTTLAVYLDDQFMFVVGGEPGKCVGGFTVNVDTLSCLPCSQFQANGPHTVRVEGHWGCPPGGGGGGFGCVQTTFTRASPATIGNPWVIDLVAPMGGNNTAAVFNFIPAGPCGFPPCESVQLIQVMKEVGFYPDGASRVLTVTEQTASIPGSRVYADSMDAWTTVDSVHIDLKQEAWSTPYVSRPPYSHGKPGRTGTMPDTARFADQPRRGQVTYPGNVSKIVLDFELNAFCAAGPGQGRYLGQCLWQWERAKNSSVFRFGKINFATGSLSQPSGAFRNALARYAARKGFKLPPVLEAPKEGGSQCP